jgi:hypothetical protein
MKDHSVVTISESAVRFILLFFVGTKGGAGKSAAAALLWFWLRKYHRHLTLMGFDVDSDNKTFTSQCEGVVSVETSMFPMDEMMEMVIKAGPGIGVVDVGANSEPVHNWIRDLHPTELLKLGIRVILVGAVSSSPESLNNLITWEESVRARDFAYLFMVRRNEKCSIRIWASDQAQALRKRVRHRVVFIPELQQDIAIHLNNYHAALPAVAAGAVSNAALGQFMMRVRLGKYCDGVYEQLNAPDVSAFLLPTQIK